MRIVCSFLGCVMVVLGIRVEVVLVGVYIVITSSCIYMTIWYFVCIFKDVRALVWTWWFAKKYLNLV